MEFAASKRTNPPFEMMLIAAEKACSDWENHSALETRAETSPEGLMPTQSLNAFLKIITRTTPQKLSDYAKYQTPGGYDFYWMLREAAHARTVGGESSAECLQPILDINRDVEKKHNSAAFKALDWWLNKENPAAFFEAPVGSFDSPSGYLSVKLEPAFGYEKDGKRRLVQLWATQTPPLTQSVAGCGLYLMKQHLCVGEFDDCVPTILNLRNKHLITAAAFHPSTVAMVASELAFADAYFALIAKAA